MHSPYAVSYTHLHDDRDFEFAKKFDIPIIQVIAKDGKAIENMAEAYTEASGTMINSCLLYTSRCV